MSEASEINKVRTHIMAYERERTAKYVKIADRATLGLPDSYIFSVWQVTVFEAKVHDDFSIESIEAKMDEYKLQRHTLAQIHRTAAFGWYVFFGVAHVAIGPPTRLSVPAILTTSSETIGECLSKELNRWVVVPKEPKLIARILVEGR